MILINEQISKSTPVDRSVFLETSEVSKGQRPPVNPSASHPRVGHPPYQLRRRRVESTYKSTGDGQLAMM